MRIYNINPINFMAKKTPIVHSEPNAADLIKNQFYANIDGFLNNQYDKKEYLKLFSDDVDKIIKQNKMKDYTPIERKYINNLISMIDMSDNLGKIPDSYLKTGMENLKKYKK